MSFIIQQWLYPWLVSYQCQEATVTEDRQKKMPKHRRENCPVHASHIGQSSPSVSLSPSVFATNDLGRGVFSMLPGIIPFAISSFRRLTQVLGWGMFQSNAPMAPRPLGCSHWHQASSSPVFVLEGKSSCYIDWRWEDNYLKRSRLITLVYHIVSNKPQWNVPFHIFNG